MVCSIGSIGAEEKETKIEIKDIPKVVKEAVEKAVPGIVITEASTEVEDGETIYEIEGKADGKEYEVEVSAAGKVLEIEKEDGDDDDKNGKDDDKDDDKKKKDDDKDNDKEEHGEH